MTHLLTVPGSTPPTQIPVTSPGNGLPSQNMPNTTPEIQPKTGEITPQKVR